MKKQEQYRNLIRFGCSLVIWGTLTAIWAYFWMRYYAEIIELPFYRRGNWLIFAIYAFFLRFFNNFYGGYRIGYYKRGDVIYSSVLAMIICNVLTYFQTSLIGRHFMYVRPFLIMTGLQLVVILVWAFSAHGLYSRLFSSRKLLMIHGGGEMAESLLQKMLSFPEKYNIKESIDIGLGIEEALSKMPQYDGVILCHMPAEPRNRILKLCFEQGIRVYTTPRIPDILIRGAADINLFDTPLLLNRNMGLGFEQRFLKRFVDILLCGIWLLIALPLMIIIAIAIKISDGGPVIYKQKRLTIGGREFYLYKFRSMIVGAEERNGAQLSTIDDERITPLGKILRMMRLDELPQLWNILRGDMSIVGPRPERPELAQQHLEEMPEFAYRLKVKAGLTGLAQIVGRYNTTPYDKLKLDLMYIMGYSLFWDLKLMLMTVKILFVKDSTQGVNDEAEKSTSLID